MVTREWYTRLVSNHRKAMRLMFVRAFMSAGLSYSDTCGRLARLERQAR